MRVPVSVRIQSQCSQCGICGGQILLKIILSFLTNYSSINAASKIYALGQPSQYVKTSAFDSNFTAELVRHMAKCRVKKSTHVQ
jgi:hypothetical protein